jgi:hypothetical protein
MDLAWACKVPCANCEWVASHWSAGVQKEYKSFHQQSAVIHGEYIGNSWSAVGQLLVSSWSDVIQGEYTAYCAKGCQGQTAKVVEPRH